MAKASAKRRIYTGVLNTPIYEPVLSAGLLKDAFNVEAKKRTLRTQLQKFRLLFDFYQLDSRSEESGFDLAFALAKAHVPGMQVISSTRKVGRTARWRRESSDLVRDVDALLASKKAKTLKRAYEILKSDKSKPWHKDTVESLGTRHREARAASRKAKDAEKEILAEYPELADHTWSTLSSRERTRPIPKRRK